MSCKNVLKSFSSDYKNIELYIYEAKENMYKLKNGKVMED
ncbi:hypothetical protein MKX57_15270 [Lysinibacillus sp. FSL M8-0216]|nr:MULTISPECIES: hypothetical protein [Lysinibacillus]MED4670324.1 hypothetical protein [Lysinibacillus fusiformis]GED66284.1 hypothetical protein LFU01_47360 [Lysinibacillus fusiformis]